MIRFFKITISILLLFFVSCSENDDSKQKIESEDTRYKLVFDSDGSGAIIGDNSNKLIKRINSTGGHLTHSFYFNETTNDFYFLSDRNNFNKFVFHKANIVEVMKSDEFYYHTQKIPIIILEKEILKDAIIDDFENIHLIVEKDFSSSYQPIYYKKISNNQIVDAVNISEQFGVGGYINVFYLELLNQIIVINDGANGLNGVIIDLKNDNMKKIALSGHSRYDIYDIIGSDSEAFILSGKYIFNMDGEIISELDRIMGNAAIGYDIKDKRFEYVERGDGINETGIINIQTGKLEKSSLGGEPGFHRSDLFFFDED